ncbi:putative L-2,4-diaminobutyrate decarboxylase [Corynebacterium halotolerans YIM 70093 = DSM 44683]|uniref:Putative L-2,4-diaminobutyrate decarboxylase n=1 Tax=Corynebacterium halotolerans YIM 70093 = DSM 44683 TaxID=1121362 RepID=M1MUX9_9CORY|nr:putative L-2,4-diaminobutyrate decarboxylase [Corynebacterium halotolerans YIM 70093 = DSM 44683]
MGGQARQLETAVAAASAFTTDHLARVDRPRSPRTHLELEQSIDAVDLEQPLGDLDEVIGELGDVWLDHAVWYHDPRYIAHLNCPITVASVAAEVMATSVNTAVESWDQATSAALIEKRLIRWTTDRIGFTDGLADGVFTSGGTQSNLQALFIAREKALASCGTDADTHAENLSRIRFLTTGNAHYSVARAARLLGLGDRGIISLGEDSRGRLNPAELDRRLAEARLEGLLPAAVIATAGTTDRGAIDPLPEITEVCRRHSVHLHVDAAYGGALLVSPRRRSWLAGIEQADSITVDFHKGFYQPVACSAVLVRRARDLYHVSWFADYLNPASSGRLNLADISLQTTRRFDALKLWVTLRVCGAAAIGEAFDRCCDLATDTARLLYEDPDFELVDPPQLSTVLFRFAPPQTGPDVDAAQLNQCIRDVLFDSGEAVVATTVIKGKACLKFTILDPTLTVDQLREVIALVRDTGHELTTPAPQSSADQTPSPAERQHLS